MAHATIGFRCAMDAWPPLLRPLPSSAVAKPQRVLARGQAGLAPDHEGAAVVRAIK